MTTMKESLGLNQNTAQNERLSTMITIKDDYLSGRLNLLEARALLKDKIGTCTPDEFAYGEQQLKGSYTDEEITHRMDELLELFDGILVRSDNQYPVNHPLWVYAAEIKAAEALADTIEAQYNEPHFIKNPWLALYDQLNTWRNHLSRKQNQLYPVLERYGFDRPTKIMWTFDDKVREAIRNSYDLLTRVDAAKPETEQAFLAVIPDVLDAFRDLLGKEQEVLLPTAYKLINDEDFVTMSRGDHEIGFALIDTPPFYVGTAGAGAPGADGSGLAGAVSSTTANPANSATAPTSADDNGISGDFLKDLAALIGKYVPTAAPAPSAIDPTTELDVATGKLSLERINLLFKHMPVDLSYVDENELVKFYSDTKHRIFPRSANVIGREVKNCHPAKSVHLVEEIIQKFRSGEQDKAEFWINKPEAFIYILYTAVRDEAGNFKGVLEMMQDCTRIRSLEGSRTLLTWDDEVHGGAGAAESAPEASSETEAPAAPAMPVTQTETEITEPPITAKTLLFDLFDKIPGLKQHMKHINPMFAMLNTPFAAMMAKKATIEMASQRTGMPMEDIIKGIRDYQATLKK